MAFRDGSYVGLQRTKPAALVNFGMHHWRWSAIPVCIFLLWLISPADDGADMEQLVAAQNQLAAANAQLDLMQRGKSNAIQQGRIAADTAAQQGRALRDAAQRNQSVALDLEAAHGDITALKAKTNLAEEARNSMAASLAQADRAIDQERRRVELAERELGLARQASDANKTRADQAAIALAGSERELGLARQASDANKTRADQAAIELAAAVKGRQNAEGALRQSNYALQDSLQVARAQAELAARYLDFGLQERKAARQIAAEQSAALEEERKKAIGVAINLSAARHAIDLIKAQSARRSARIGQAIEMGVAADSPASQSTLQRRSQARSQANSKVQKTSKRVVVATTITLPDALLPTPQNP